MSDLLKDANVLRFFHTSDDMSRDKDYLKNQLHEKYHRSVNLLFVTPILATMMQIRLAGNPANLAMYN